jgi:hypothetical protein
MASHLPMVDRSPRRGLASTPMRPNQAPPQYRFVATAFQSGISRLAPHHAAPYVRRALQLPAGLFSKGGHARLRWRRVALSSGFRAPHHGPGETGPAASPIRWVLRRSADKQTGRRHAAPFSTMPSYCNARVRPPGANWNSSPAWDESNCSMTPCSFRIAVADPPTPTVTPALTTE